MGRLSADEWEPDWYPPPPPRRRWQDVICGRGHGVHRPGSGGGAVLVALAAFTILVAGSCGLLHHMSAALPAQAPVPAATGSVPSDSPATVSPSASQFAMEPAGRASCVDQTLARLTLDEQIGQLLMIGTPIADPVSIVAAIRRYHLGGVFLAGRSSGPAPRLRQWIGDLQDSVAASGVSLHIGLDQEGGQVQTLRGPDFPRIPSAVEQGSLDADALRRRTVDWSRRLASVGVTIDLAPVADVVPAGVGARNPPIGAFDRQYGSTPGGVATDVRTVVRAAQGTGILTTLKHFPGLGRVLANTDTSMGAVDSLTNPGDPALQPFIEGIQAGAAAVMVSSARYPQLDAYSVAAFSAPIITGLLRHRLGYTGLVMSDDLGQAVAVSAVPLGDRAVRFVRAGGDVVLSVRSSDAGPMSAALVAAARSSTAFQARVADAAGHVLQSKYRAGLLRCPS